MSTPSNFEAQVMNVLRGHLSAISCRSILQRSMARALPPGVELDASNAKQMFMHLRAGLTTFCGPTLCEDIMARLERLTEADSEGPEDLKIRVVVEHQNDISQARWEALEFCRRAGVDRFTTQKITTAVSELARNIADYSHGGWVELERDAKTIRIFASDRGPGIPHLESVLDGSYRSRTGLGQGLAGLRRMMDFTDIRTSSEGTHVKTEVAAWR